MEPGDEIAGKYRVERALGGGGMGRVVAARHLGLDTPVAVKLLSETALADPVALERFEREARVVARLQTEHVARVLDFGTTPAGQPYLVMERLDGADLGHAKGLGVSDIVDAVLGACDAIAEAHALGVVHRDLKPSNLFLAKQSDGTRLVKVLDFGIAKADLLRGAGAGITGSSDVFGSPMYMSPEQLKATATVDGRTDIWSFGVILYELLSGTPPFHQGTVAEIWNGILTAHVPPLITSRELPPGLDAVVSRCLEKDPARRYATAGDLAAALAPFSSGSPDALRSAERAQRYRDGRASVTSEDRHRHSGTLSPANAPARQGWGTGSTLALALGLTAVIGGAAFYWRRPAPAADAPASPAREALPRSAAAPGAAQPPVEPSPAAPAASPSAAVAESGRRPVDAAPSARASASGGPQKVVTAASARAKPPPRKGSDPFSTPD